MVREVGEAVEQYWPRTPSSLGNNGPTRLPSSFVLSPVDETGRSTPPAASGVRYFHLSA